MHQVIKKIIPSIHTHIRLLIYTRVCIDIYRYRERIFIVVQYREAPQATHACKRSIGVSPAAAGRCTYTFNLSRFEGPKCTQKHPNACDTPNQRQFMKLRCGLLSYHICRSSSIDEHNVASSRSSMVTASMGKILCYVTTITSHTQQQSAFYLSLSYGAHILKLNGPYVTSLARWLSPSKYAIYIYVQYLFILYKQQTWARAWKFAFRALRESSLLNAIANNIRESVFLSNVIIISTAYTTIQCISTLV